MRILLVIFAASLLVGCGSAPVATPADRWIARNGGCCEVAPARLDRLAARFESVLDTPLKLSVLDRCELRAYSFPSGQVILTRGLVAALSDDELTAVIGHEVGHLLNDGHATATAALTGRTDADDTETAADAVSVRLLAALHVPPDSLRSALQKVYATLPPDSPNRETMHARIQGLP